MKKFYMLMFAFFLIILPKNAFAEQKIYDESGCFDNKDSKRGYESFEIDQNGTLCIFTDITKEISEKILVQTRTIKTLIIRSSSGDFGSTIDIANRVFDNKSHVVILELCLSPCSNYIVPAAKSVEVVDHSIVAMPYTIPRGYISFFMSEGAKNGFADLVKNRQKVRENFRSLRESILKREIDFFDRIGKDDAYITRSLELTRSAKFELQRKCAQSEEFVLVLDPTYLEQFGIKVDKWNPVDALEAQSGMNRIFSNINVLVGFLGMPAAPLDATECKSKI